MPVDEIVLRRKLATAKAIIRWLVIEFLKMETRAEKAEIAHAQASQEIKDISKAFLSRMRLNKRSNQ
jgi:hypothetical protein